MNLTFSPLMISLLTKINHRKLFLSNFAVQKRINFTFGTTKKINKAIEKINSKISGVRQIKIWSLQDLMKTTTRQSLNNKPAVEKVNTLKSLFNNDDDKLREFSSPNQGSFNIVINKYFSTIQNESEANDQRKDCKIPINKKAPYQQLIEILNDSQNWGFIPHYHNIINRHLTQTENKLKLIIGDYNQSILSALQPNQYITLQQLCAMYPEKVPLSYRKRQTIEGVRSSISKRLGQGPNQLIRPDQEPRYNEIIIINDRIKMWDEAYQIMLDQLPIKITVPFHLIEPSQNFHKLNLHNFIQGFKTCHRIIHPQIELNIQQQNLRQFLTEFLKESSKGVEIKNRKIGVEVMDEDFKKQQKEIFEISL